MTEASSMQCCVPKGLTCEFGSTGTNQDQIRIPLYCTNPICNIDKYMHPLCHLRWEQTLLSVLVKTSTPTMVPLYYPSASYMACGGRSLEILAQLSLCPCGEGILSKHVTPPIFNQLLNNSALTMNKIPGNSTQQTSLPPCFSRQRTLSSSSTLSTSIPSPSPFNDSGFFDFNSSFTSSLAELSPSTPSHAATKMNSQMQTFPYSGASKRTRHRSTPGHHSTSTTFPYGEILPENLSIVGGNIFHRRVDYDVFLQLPKGKQNSYFICMEDDGCNGNDEAKAFLLSKLTTFRANSMPCLICHQILPIFDHFPLVDGTFFFSPISHDNRACFPISIPTNCHQSPLVTGHRLTIGGETIKFLHVICMSCMHNEHVQCRYCKQIWSGSRLLVGGVYQFDITAGIPCCSHRVSCKCCGFPLQGVIDAISGRSTACSVYSELIRCPVCARRDYHLVKPFWDIFNLVEMNPSMDHQMENQRSGSIDQDLVTEISG